MATGTVRYGMVGCGEIAVQAFGALMAARNATLAATFDVEHPPYGRPMVPCSSSTLSVASRQTASVTWAMQPDQPVHKVARTLEAIQGAT